MAFFAVGMETAGGQQASEPTNGGRLAHCYDLATQYRCSCHRIPTGTGENREDRIARGDGQAFERPGACLLAGVIHPEHNFVAGRGEVVIMDQKQVNRREH
jgi:hypothetical protein